MGLGLWLMVLGLGLSLCHGRAALLTLTCLLALVTAELQRDKDVDFSGQGDRGGIGQQQGGGRVHGLNELNAAVDAGTYLTSQLHPYAEYILQYIYCRIYTAESDFIC